ncbi:MAG: hypothetical protein K1X75_07770 [Leptospirales bacterium]|nr:hypothetical protein [Leptospirales bacterium]
MGEYHLFEFSPETIDRFRTQREIPVHFYNKDGQILIYKKEQASDAEIDRLLRFVQQGIYYNTDDMDVLGIKKKKGEGNNDGLSDVKLLTEDHAGGLTHDTAELFGQLKRGTITSLHAKQSSERLNKLFQDFEQQPDAMNGLVNIIELMTGMGAEQEVEMAVKRTVVSMALKTRGMKAQSLRDQQRIADQVNVLMMSALLCDIGYGRMQMPADASLSDAQMEYIRNHPMMSYLMLAHEPSIDPRVKRNILCHHRPMRTGAAGNNYPNMKLLLGKLNSLEERYRTEPGKDHIAADVRKQLQLLKTDLAYDEDANVLALASEFASLTSKTSWRDAFSPRRAVQMIVNNSFFTYTDRIVREFLDHVAMSLCDNERIITEGDFVIVASRGSDGRPFFEVCQIDAASRYQSKPQVSRFATIQPEIARTPRMCFVRFDLDHLRPDPRFAKFDLLRDDSRHIVYAVDAHYDEEMHRRFTELTAGRRRGAVDPAASE